MQTSALKPTLTPLALGTHVQLEGSAETGTITGCADYLDDATQYQVRYVNGQGCLTSAWWPAAALTPIGDTASEPQPKATPHQFAIPELAPGERYAGIVIDLDNGQPTHHLVLLPAQPAERLTWDEAMAWAASIGAELPTRQEAALLYANLKPAFEPEWHWTGEQYAGYASDAWLQVFNDGLQLNVDKGRVRAVRRFLID